jgi:competence protein ComEC
VIATHFDADHIGGLPAVLDEEPTQMLLCGGVPFESRGSERLLTSAREDGVQVKRAVLGEVFHLGPGIQAVVLNPGPVPMTGTGSDSNNNSVVLRLVYRDVSFLFTGDAEAPAQRAVMSRGLPLQSTVLKVPHHGSRDATLPDFDRAVHPALAVISVGEGNRYGHPSRAALSALEAAGARILRTDLSGAISIRSDGRTWRALAYRDGRWRPAAAPARAGTRPAH